MDQTKGIRYNTDKAMKIIWTTLCDDLGITCMPSARAALAAGDIPRFRRELDSFRISYSTGVGDFKRIAQALSWTKRYRFADDLFSDAELASRSWGKYSDCQKRLARPIRTDVLYRSGLVSRWRRIAASILGEYSEAEHFERCAFAKNACFGHPARRKGLDQKLKGPLTGSTEHILFLQRYVESDPTLREIIQHLRVRPVPSLRLTFVPKSYKALRAVMPDTLAGSFYSSGLGEMIKDRLKKAGLNINTLQRKHRKIAMRSSRGIGWRGWSRSAHERLATIDLSSASDSISTQLLSLILPRKWFHAVTKGRVPCFDFADGRYRLMSACTMGLGHTFALETLIFYVITKGLMEWYGYEDFSALSVYGDDIIVPSRVITGDGRDLPTLTSVFRCVHVELNREKSFVGWCDFRESCGGDFYRGHDVRPASPQAEHQLLQPREYACFLYKLANALLQRWSEFAIESTLAWISLEIYSVLGEVLAIPSYFPDTSGLKVQPGTFLTDEPERVNFGSLVVKHLLGNFGHRAILLEKALFWDSLRRSSKGRPAGKPVAASLILRRVRSVKVGKRVVKIPFFCVTDHTSYKGVKLAKSVVPNWLKTSSVVPS